MSIIIISVVFLLIYVLITMSVNFECYKYYKLTYNKLVNKDFIFQYKSNLDSLKPIYTFTDKDSKTSLLNSDYKHEILIFLQEKNGILIKLYGDDLKYIHYGFITYFDPYTLYWYFKFKKWFFENKNEFNKTFIERYNEVFSTNFGRK